jgi:hypothetical protein
VCRHVIVVMAIHFLFRGRPWRPVQWPRSDDGSAGE